MIGWDGADRTTVNEWMRKGALPNLTALRARGISGRTASLPGLGDDAHWGSFATGTGPGFHGRFHYRRIVPGSYRLGDFFRDRMQGEPFWSQIGDAGRRVAVLDVPKSPLAQGLNGIQLADWLPHGEDGPEPVSWPPALAKDLPERFRPRAGFTCHRLRTGVAELAELYDRIREHLALRTGLALDWLGQEPWNLFLAVFAESHCIGHHCWHLHDPHHPEHDRDAVRMLGDPMREIHQTLDEALGRLLAESGADTTVIVFSLLGMGPNYMNSWLADAVLKQLDTRNGITTKSPPADCPPGASPPIGAGTDQSEHANATAFIVHSDSCSTALRLNMAGREPHGRVPPGDYRARCQWLADTFLALSDPDDGRPLVSEVVRVADRFPGPHASAYADLLVVWRADAPIRRAVSDAVGIIGSGPPHRDRTGNHRPGGWFLAAGPGIAPGTLDAPAAIVDLAPTVGAILGVALRGMEGAPIRALS
jgi:predicted AlkP superfamily phosphohydrolase/phosphomutase